MTETIQKIIEAIRSNSSFLLTSHEGPDGDAVGSTLALASFLRKIGKDVAVHFKDQVPDLYAFLPGCDAVLAHIPDRSFDVAFILDIGELRRAGSEFCDFKRVNTLINLDHHLSCDNFGTHNLIDSTAAATGVLVYRIISAFGYSMDLETAICLYVSIITDTGSFRYSNANREAFTIAGEMIECGVNAWDVAEQLYPAAPTLERRGNLAVSRSRLARTSMLELDRSVMSSLSPSSFPGLSEPLLGWAGGW